jgi:hypothetical protein
MIVSHSLKFIFVHINKTGGTSIKNAVKPVLGEGDFNNLGEGKHLSAHDIQKRYPEEWDDYFTFGFIRNPWDRTVSRYFFWKQMNQKKVPASFEEFVKSGQFASYTLCGMLCIGKNPIVDFIGRFENLNNDFAEICSRIGIEITLPHINGSKHNHYASYYDSETWQIVQDHYKNDVEKFYPEYAK